MGANTFYIVTKGKNAAEAFRKAADDARYEHGHGGYTGTIAEKYEFVMMSSNPIEYEIASEMALKFIDERDPRVDDDRPTLRSRTDARACASAPDAATAIATQARSIDTRWD